MRSSRYLKLPPSTPAESAPFRRCPLDAPSPALSTTASRWPSWPCSSRSQRRRSRYLRATRVARSGVSWSSLNIKPWSWVDLSTRCPARADEVEVEVTVPGWVQAGRRSPTVKSVGGRSRTLNLAGMPGTRCAEATGGRQGRLGAERFPPRGGRGRQAHAGNGTATPGPGTAHGLGGEPVADRQ